MALLLSPVNAPSTYPASPLLSQVRTPLGRLQIIAPLLGVHNVSNILAAVATGIAGRVKLREIVAGVEAVDIIPGRSEILDEVRVWGVGGQGGDLGGVGV